jgi:hypothetical protein
VTRTERHVANGGGVQERGLRAHPDGLGVEEARDAEVLKDGTKPVEREQQMGRTIAEIAAECDRDGGWRAFVSRRPSARR